MRLLSFTPGPFVHCGSLCYLPIRIKFTPWTEYLHSSVNLVHSILVSNIKGQEGQRCLECLRLSERERVSRMKFFLLFATLASFGATRTLARNINARSAEMRQFIRLLDKNGNDGVSLEEVKEKLDEWDLEIGGGSSRWREQEVFEAMVIPSFDLDGDNLISLKDMEVQVEAFLGLGFQMMDRDADSQISESEINGLADQIPSDEFPVPLSQIGQGAANYDTDKDSQISVDEFKNMLEEGAELILGLLDHNDDRNISFGEVKFTAMGLVQEAIGVVDLDGNGTISAQEISNAVDPNTLSKAFMNLLDANEDGEVRYEDLESIEIKYGSLNSIDAVRAGLNDLASAFRDTQAATAAAAQWLRSVKKTPEGSGCGSAVP